MRTPAKMWRSAIAGFAMAGLALLAALSPALATPSGTGNAGGLRAVWYVGQPDSSMSTHVAQLRQLDIDAVPVRSVSREELRESLLQDSADELEEIGVTQDLLVLLDLLEDGQNLRDVMVEAYTQETLGFYDPEKDELHLIGDSASPTDPWDKLTLAHEYTHALQDQHFDLSALLEQGDDSEAAAAARALVEGDATVVMALYYVSYLSPEERAVIGEMSAEPGKEPGADVPAFIQKTMLFPYEYGTEFVVALIKQGKWEAVNKAYSDPPKSTEQILHPEKYYQDRDDPLVVNLPDMAAAMGKKWSEVDSGVFGEFDLKLYLEALIDTAEAEKATSGWGGDCYSFLRDDAGKKAFVLKTEWDTADDAREFYEAATQRARNRGGSGNQGYAQGSKAFAEWESHEISYRFALDETCVRLVTASDAKTADKAMAASSRSAKSSVVWVCVGVGIGLACIVGLFVLFLRRRGQGKPAAESGFPK